MATSMWGDPSLAWKYSTATNRTNPTAPTYPTAPSYPSTPSYPVKTTATPTTTMSAPQTYSTNTSTVSPTIPTAQGYQLPSTSTMTGYDPTLLPQLLNPSSQYWARMNPQLQQQYYGYEQARTGATPEATQWRLWSMAPPSGTYRGLNYRR